MRPARRRGSAGTARAPPPPSPGARKFPALRLVRLAAVVTPLAPAGQEPLATVRPGDEEGGSALGAAAGDRPLPDDELARRVVRAAVVRLAALGAPLGQLATAPLLGARDPDRDRPGRLALWIARAGDEAAEAALLEH